MPPFRLRFLKLGSCLAYSISLNKSHRRLKSCRCHCIRSYVYFFRDGDVVFSLKMIFCSVNLAFRVTLVSCHQVNTVRRGVAHFNCGLGRGATKQII